MVTRLLQVKRSTGNVRQPKTDVLLLCHTTSPKGHKPSVIIVDLTLFHK